MTLQQIVETHLSDEAIGRLADAFSESREATRRVLRRGALPAVTATLARAHAGEAGAGRLLELLRAGGHDGGLLARLPAALGGGAETDALVAVGRGLLPSLLGAHEEPVVALLASATGVRRTSAGALLAISVPLVLAALGQRAGGQARDIAALLGRAPAAALEQGEPGLAAALGIERAERDPHGDRKLGYWQWLVVPAVTLVVFYVLRQFQQGAPPHEPATAATAPSEASTAAAPGESSTRETAATGPVTASTLQDAAASDPAATADTGTAATSTVAGAAPAATDDAKAPKNPAAPAETATAAAPARAGSTSAPASVPTPAPAPAR
ncbi:MAG: DUF937 domain-containing protein [Steroidobacteraceae bacterium]